MNVEWLRQHCLRIPNCTEAVQWGNDLVFKIGGKMFAVAPLEPGGHIVSFKGTPEEFAELTERPGVIPAPYLARAHWVTIQTEGALSRAEIKERIQRSHDLVMASLTKKTQAALAAGSFEPPPAKKRKAKA